MAPVPRFCVPVAHGDTEQQCHPHRKGRIWGKNSPKDKPGLPSPNLPAPRCPQTALSPSASICPYCPPVPSTLILHRGSAGGGTWGTFWGAVRGVTARTKECCPPGEGTRCPGACHTLKEQQPLHDRPTVSCVFCHRVPRCPQCHRAELETAAPGGRSRWAGGVAVSPRCEGSAGRWVAPAGRCHAWGGAWGGNAGGRAAGRAWVSAGERGSERSRTQRTAVRVSEHTRVGAWTRV